MEETQPQEKMEKLKMPTVIQESAEWILGKYLEVVNEIPEITDIVYAYYGKCNSRENGR